jgi:hypothetical protein
MCRGTLLRVHMGLGRRDAVTLLWLWWLLLVLVGRMGPRLVGLWGGCVLVLVHVHIHVRVHGSVSCVRSLSLQEWLKSIDQSIN